MSAPSGPYHDTNGDGGTASRSAPRKARSGSPASSQKRWKPSSSVSWSVTNATGTATIAAATTACDGRATRASPRRDHQPDGEHDQGRDEVEPAVPSHGAGRVDGVDREPARAAPGTSTRSVSCDAPAPPWFVGAKRGMKLPCLRAVDVVPEGAERDPGRPRDGHAGPAPSRSETEREQREHRQRQQRRRLRRHGQRQRERAEREVHPLSPEQEVDDDDEERRERDVVERGRRLKHDDRQRGEEHGAERSCAPVEAERTCDARHREHRRQQRDSWKSAAYRSSPESVIAHEETSSAPGVKTSSRRSFARST